MSFCQKCGEKLVMSAGWVPSYNDPDNSSGAPVSEPICPNGHGEEKPYIVKEIITYEQGYNKNFGDNRLCGCGHEYYRHFDTWEDMYASGCKYCCCRTFHEGQNTDDIERNERYNQSQKNN